MGLARTRGLAPYFLLNPSGGAKPRLTSRRRSRNDYSTVPPTAEPLKSAAEPQLRIHQPTAERRRKPTAQRISKLVTVGL
jgi:hypothetical protein